MDLAVGSFGARLVVLVIDAAGAGDLVVDRLRIPGPLRAVVLAHHYRRGPHPRVLARCERDAVPELLGVLQPDSLRKTVPRVEELPDGPARETTAELWGRRPAFALAT